MGYLVTPGAAGTWALADVAGLALKNLIPSFNPHNRDPSSVPDNARVAYVYSNAFDTILSFWRRGFMHDPAHAEHLGVVLHPTKRKTLTGWFHDIKHDPFLLREHMTIWYERPLTKLFKYEALDDPLVIDELCSWIDADLQGFKFKRRNSDWTREKTGVVHGLARVYGRLFSIQYGLGTVEYIR